ncbi:Protein DETOXIFICATION 16 [Linum grandiflorum]
MIPYGLGAAASTRVSNELGAGNPDRARLAVRIVVGMVVLEGILVGGILFSIRTVWGSVYSNDKSVINYVAQMLPIAAIAGFLDGLQCVLSGSVFGAHMRSAGASIFSLYYYNSHQLETRGKEG